MADASLSDQIAGEVAALRSRMNDELAGFRGRLLNKATMISLAAGATTALRTWLVENDTMPGDWCMRVFGAGDEVPDHFGWREGAVVGQSGSPLEKQDAVVLLCNGDNDVYVTCDALPAYLRGPLNPPRIEGVRTNDPKSLAVEWSGHGCPPPELLSVERVAAGEWVATVLAPIVGEQRSVEIAIAEPDEPTERWYAHVERKQDGRVFVTVDGARGSIGTKQANDEDPTFALPGDQSACLVTVRVRTDLQEDPRVEGEALVAALADAMDETEAAIDEAFDI